MTPPERSRAQIFEEDILPALLFNAPLFIGAFTVRGFVVERVLVFSLIVAVVVIAQRAFPAAHKWTKARHFALASLTLALVGIILVFGALIGDPRASLLLLVYALLASISPRVPLQTRYEAVRNGIAITFAMGSLAVLGVVSQSGIFVWGTAALGLLPAGPFVGALIAKSARTLEHGGLARRRSVKTKSGESTERPGGLAQLYSYFTVVLPGLLLLAAPLGMLPEPFLFGVLVVLASIRLATDLYDEKRSDEEVRLLTMTLAFGTTLLSLIIGLISGG